MKNRKLNLDRPPISKEQIDAHSSFDKVLDSYKSVKPTLWKNPWFYGPAGIASLALIVSLSLSAFQKTENQKYDKIITQTSNLPEDTKCIQKPIKEDIPYTENLLDLSLDQTVNLPGGSTVTIPAGCFNTTKKSATLKTREFHDKADIFISGVLMDCENSAFESAGMIEVRVVDENDIELEFNKDKSILISLPVNNPDKDFQFWRLNEDEVAWQEFPCTYSSEPLKSVSQSEIMNVKTEVKKVENKISQIEIIQKGLKTPEKVNYKLPIDNRQRFELDFDPALYPELRQLSKIEFEIAETGKYDRSFTKKTWTSVNLIKNNKQQYIAHFKNGREEFQILVRPVLTGADMEKANIQFEKDFTKYEEDKANLHAEKLKLETENKELERKMNDLIRDLELQESKKRQAEQEAVRRANFAINTFGFYNCDKKVNYPGPFVNEAILSWENKSTIRAKTIYVFDEKRNLRYSYGSGQQRPIQDFGLKNNSKNYILVADENNKMGYVIVDTHEEIEQIIFRTFTEKDVSSMEIKAFLDVTKLPA